MSANDLAIHPQPSPERVAFGRYLASIERDRPFAATGQFALFVEASAPELYKGFAMLAIRKADANGHSEFLILGVDGDGAVAQEVITRYFAIEEQMADSAAITPENYRFQFKGLVKTGDGGAYAYDIAPRKRRTGVFKGQIWIDAATGAELLVSGRLADFPSGGNSVSFVRELKLDAAGSTRVSHATFSVPILGRSEVIVTERPLASNSQIPRLEGLSSN